METETRASGAEGTILDREVIGWRCEQLLAAGFPLELGDELARDDRLDLHALIELVERGCEPRLAVRILAPLEEDRSDA